MVEKKAEAPATPTAAPTQALEKRSPEELAEIERAAAEEAMQKLLFYGDLSGLTKKQQAEYCFQLAKTMGLNPWTKPFDMIPDGKGSIMIYANKGCASQLRHNRHIDLSTIYEGPLKLGDSYDTSIYTVVVEASIPDDKCYGGYRRVRQAGSISIHQLIGEARANAVMKCYTKAVRRATLDVCGIGFPDESELDSIGGMRQEPEPRRFEPRPMPAGSGNAGPQPLPQIVSTPPTAAPSERVDTKTGEIVDAEPVAAPKPNAAAPAPPPPAGRSKFPPAVAPVGVKPAQ